MSQFQIPKGQRVLDQKIRKVVPRGQFRTFPFNCRSFHRKEGGTFFFKSLCKVSRNHLLVRKSTLAILRMTQFSDKSMEYSNVHTFAIEVSSDDHENDDVSDACHRAFTSSFIVITDENKVYHAVLGSRCIRRQRIMDKSRFLLLKVSQENQLTDRSSLFFHTTTFFFGEK